MINLTVFNKRVGPVRGRHPWVFSGALKHIPEGLESGMPVQLRDENNNFLAQGYFNSYSQIAVRVWSWDEKEEVNEDFFVKKISAAYELRNNLVADKKTDAFRVVNSENDLLPGLIVDKYGDYLSVQLHNKGIDFWKKQIVSALNKVLKPKGIFERSDVGNREKENNSVFARSETTKQSQPVILSPSASLRINSAKNPLNTGIQQYVGVLYGDIPKTVKITENGFKFNVDIAGGQKTGFFLDQRDKRNALQKYCAHKKVLNCFCYTGGFSVYALGAGAKKVVSVDSSQSALELAEENIKLNKLDSKKSEFVLADVKEYLSGLQAQDPELKGEKFEVIILDPPAFVKNRHKVHEGLQGYKKINEAAMRLLPAGGILVSASCSQHVSLTDFRHMISEAAGRAGRIVQILETYTHGIDHPELAAFTEGEYLKCVFAIVR